MFLAHTIKKLVLMVLCAVVLQAQAPLPAISAEPAIPKFWDSKERLRRPKL